MSRKMSVRRTFIALDVSAAAREACRDHIERLRRMFPNVRVGWELPEKLHMTVKFLGDTDDAAVRRLQEKIDAVAKDTSPFWLRLSKTGVFPSPSRPRIIWIGLEDATGSTEAIHAAIESACAELGYEIDNRTFRPHVTIGRVREPVRAGALAEKHLQTQVEPVDFEVTDLVLYESKLQPTGSVYFPLFKAQLGSRLE
jgi:2'-5' RNA ligase